MDQYYNEYFNGRQAAPNSNEGRNEESNTHLMASSMMNGGGARANGGYNGPASYGNDGPAQGASPSGQMTNAKIYVSNMPGNCDERQLTEMFGRYGDIIAITHKGSYAFIEYAEPGMADDAISEMRSSGNPMRVQLAFSKAPGSFGGGRGGGGGGDDYGAPAAPKKFGGNSNSGGNSCFRCGEDGHWASACPMNGGMGRG